MDSSSDESFAWTNASNSSKSSDSNIVQSTMTGKTLDEDTDYGSSYKKKLHKKLFINNEASDESNTEANQNYKKKSKRKKIDDDIVESPKKKKVKIEPESDIETPKKKKKISDASHLDESMSSENIAQNYSNLNIRVKKEEILVSPPPKSKKQRRNTLTTMDMVLNHDGEHNLNDNIKNDENNTELHETSCTLSIDESYTKKKKKKSKKRKHSMLDDDHASTEDMGTEDTAAHLQQNEIEQEELNEKSEKKKSIQKQKVKIESHISEKSDVSGDDDCINQSHKNNHKLESPKSSSMHIIDNKSEVLQKASKRVSRISDRIQFEDVDTTQMDTSSQVENVNSRKLKKFLKMNKHLEEIQGTREHSEWTLSANDEIWAVRCPQNLDINSFLGKNIKLDRKSKIKVDSQTYIGTMNSETGSVNVLTLEHKKYVINKLPLMGTLHLRRKIPKVHIPDDNVIIDNQTDFVPLPDTKKRHPLFGSDYKKSIKLPTAVEQRLVEPYTPCEIVTKKKKKKKQESDKTHPMDVDDAQTAQPLPECYNTPVKDKDKKKNRKRKHQMDSEHSSTKRVKYTADPSVVWESEQAIEENLFNF